MLMAVGEERLVLLMLLEESANLSFIPTLHLPIRRERR